MKRLLIVLVILMVALVLVSCNKEEIDLSSYKIVIPEGSSTAMEYSARSLANLILNKYGITVSVVYDSEAEAENEILIGETNRNASKTDTPLGKSQFLLVKKGNKIVLKGDGIYIGSACGRLLNEHLIAKDNEIFIKNLTSKEKIYTYEAPSNCKNVIFMIGDGMGENHIKLGESKGSIDFIAKQFPNIGWSITRSQSVINGDEAYTDSAASGTAMATGYKTINGYLGLDKDGNLLLNVRELAHSNGARTAIVTTDAITGATPSAFLCHNISRENKDELQSEIDDLISNGKVHYCKGDVGDNLTLETKNALNVITKDNSSFFIMIEEAHIDKRSHSKDLDGAGNAVVRFNDAIEYATQFALMYPNTALIVTADHETGDLIENPFSKDGFSFRSSNHTNKNVPVFALGAGTSIFNGATIENVELARFTASAYSNDSFGMSLDALPTINTKTRYYYVACFFILGFYF